MPNNIEGIYDDRDAALLRVSELETIVAELQAKLDAVKPACTALTDAELVDRCNELAGVIRRALGWGIPEGYEFHLHLDKPRVKHGWDMAALVLEHLEGHEMADALASVLASEEPGR